MRRSRLIKRLFVLTLCVVLTAAAFSGLSEGESHTHTWSAADTVGPTCTKDGYTVYVCSECGETENRDFVSASGHAWEKSITLEPTCEIDGYTLYICSRCDESEQRDHHPAVGHNWIPGEKVEAACDTEGYTAYTCSKCGAMEKRDVVPALGHVWEATAIYMPSCDTVGYTEYTCTVCGAVKADDEVPPLGHEWSEWTISVEPTCTETGLEVRVCSECGLAESNILPTGHVWNEDGVCEKCGAHAVAKIGSEIFGSLQAAIEAAKADDVVVLLADGACELAENQTVRIDANGFELEVTVPEDCTLIQEDDTYTAMKAYAETEGETYTSLKAAVAAALPDGIVTVLADEIGEGIVIDKNLTIDFGEFTYTAKNPGGVKENPEDPSEGAVFELMPGTTVTLMNGSKAGSIKGTGNAKYLIQNNSDQLILKDVTLNALLNANLKYALSNNRGEVVLTGETTINGGVGQWAIDLWMNEDDRVLMTLDADMTGTVAGYVRIYPDSEVRIESDGYRLVEKGIDEATECPFYCIAVVKIPTPTPTAEPKPTPTPTPTIRPTATPTLNPSATPDPSVSPSVSPSASPSPSPSPSPTATSSGGGGGSGSGSGSGSNSSSGSASDSADETGTDAEISGADMVEKGITDYTLEYMRDLAEFLSGGIFGN